MGLWIPALVGAAVAVLCAMVPTLLPRTGTRANDECVIFLCMTKTYGSKGPPDLFNDGTSVLLSAVSISFLIYDTNWAGGPSRTFHRPTCWSP